MFFLKRMSSAFWVEVSENWQILGRKQQPISNSDLMNTSIWYNPKISREPLYFSNWFNAGVSLLGDIQKRYNIKCNILDYYRIKLSVQNFVKKFSFEESFNYSRPSCTFHLRILFKSSKGVKEFYQIFLSNPGCRPIAQIKWQSLADVNISNFRSVIYKICFKSTHNNSYV